MATMVKEKRREKRKVKEKSASRSNTEREQPSIVTESLGLEGPETFFECVYNDSEEHPQDASKPSQGVTEAKFNEVEQSRRASSETENTVASSIERSTTDNELTSVKETDSEINRDEIVSTRVNYSEIELSSLGNTYLDLNSRIERISIPALNQNLSLEEIQDRLENPLAYMRLEKEAELEMRQETAQSPEVVENVVPSAPVFEEAPATQYYHHQTEEIVIESKPQQQCMPLEEAIRLYGGMEMEIVQAISEREAAIVEAGPQSGPDHPLVDLLSTFRSSLIAVDRERLQLSKGYREEEASRAQLWRVEARSERVAATCACGLAVRARVAYAHAALRTERLPAAKLRLEALLRDVQDSYCHHQHAALLAYCQIEELVCETTRGAPGEARAALALVLRALRLCGAPAALGAALQRWAAALGAALVRAGDLPQLLHLIHHLYSQTRSVRWAARAIRGHVRVGDALGLLAELTRPPPGPAGESAGDGDGGDGGWEELGRGGGGAVCDGALRERDLLALLRALPARRLLADIVQLTHHDIRSARAAEWGAGGGGVLRASCGVRALLAGARRGVTSLPAYPRARAHLRRLAARALRALAALHRHQRDSYPEALQAKIFAELQACFCEGCEVLGAERLHQAPAALLDDCAAKEYCTALSEGLHDKSPRQLRRPPLALPARACGLRVRTAARAARDRPGDRQVAQHVIDLLLQCAPQEAGACGGGGGCVRSSRTLLAGVLRAHPSLHAAALHALAARGDAGDEATAAARVAPLALSWWRPPAAEAVSVLQVWAEHCGRLLPHLLLQLDCTPHSGLSLETQLAVGSWLCQWLQHQPPPPPEWAWSALRRLRVHRSDWSAPLDAPPPHPPPQDLFSTAYALLSSSWGHCIPVICAEGVSALCALAAARAGEAAHCLARVMRVMAHSPESVSLTPKFEQVVAELARAGPTLVQRALGRGPAPGADALLRAALADLQGHGAGQAGLLSAWLHLLCRPALPTHAPLEALLLATRAWPHVDHHAAALMQEAGEAGRALVRWAVGGAGGAPLLCACVLRAAQAQALAGGLPARLLDALHAQRAAAARIHVDNALKQVGATYPSEELVIHRCAAALLAAPAPPRAGHLPLWALFFHLYLQRPPCSPSEATPPVGPLFFSGLIKSRVLTQLKKKLQDAVDYHRNEALSLKQNDREETPQAPPRSRNLKKNSAEDCVLPMLTIRDLTGESSESSDSETDSDSSDEGSEESETEEKESKQNRTEGKTSDANGVKKKEDAVLLEKYHIAAENMCAQFVRWLEEGERTRAAPHHADVARFLPAQVLDAAWSRELSALLPSPPEQAPPPRPPPPPPAPPLQAAVASILSIKDDSEKRCRTANISSPLGATAPDDARALLTLTDRHLADVTALADEWCTESARISSLDEALWPLVRALREPRPKRERAQCANKCAPITLLLTNQEWCVMPGAESSIADNRRAALALVRRLARPRPRAARSAAALAAIARHIRSAEAAVRVADRAWACARNVHTCAPAHAALTALVEGIADRWLCHNGKICSDLLTRWGKECNNTLQQALMGALVSPRRLDGALWPPVYRALLQASLPPVCAFSYLSKFELSRWAAAGPARRELLGALLAAAQRWGPHTDTETQMLLELIGVHTAALLNPAELCAHVQRCTRAAVAGSLPPAHWPHVTRAADAHAHNVPFDELGHCLRALGVAWGDARGAHAHEHAPHVALLLCALVSALAAAAHALSYAPERVSVCAWGALQEAWAPWVCPRPAAPPPLLAPEPHAHMARQLVGTVRRLMRDRPGIEESLLQQIFEWTVQTYVCACAAPDPQTVLLSSLLQELSELPWTEHQWVRTSCLHHALQVCASRSAELQAWASAAWRGAAAHAWTRGCDDSHLAPLLASLLCLFTAMPHHEQTLAQAALLPWTRLPEPALEEALDGFFRHHHDPARPYHLLPQFRLVLCASELVAPPSPSPRAPRAPRAPGASRGKRAAAVSRWVRAASAPALSAHVPAHTRALLAAITDIAPHLEHSEGELEELLGRATAILCIEPAASDALPVWCEWVRAAPAHLPGACVCAAAHITAFDSFAALADASVKAYMADKAHGWAGVAARLRDATWREAGPLLLRARLHAAYGLLRARPHSPEDTRQAMLALCSADIDYVENEAVFAVWACAAGRAARGGGGAGGGGAGEAARAVLVRGAGEARRWLLRLVTMTTDSAAHTARHRALCRLALCICTPTETGARAYEASVCALQCAGADAHAWGRNPRACLLPRLAARLFPDHHHYFQDELELAPDDSC